MLKTWSTVPDLNRKNSGWLFLSKSGVLGRHREGLDPASSMILSPADQMRTGVGLRTEELYTHVLLITNCDEKLGASTHNKFDNRHFGILKIVPFTVKELKRRIPVRSLGGVWNTFWTITTQSFRSSCKLCQRIPQFTRVEYEPKTHSLHFAALHEPWVAVDTEKNERPKEQGAHEISISAQEISLFWRALRTTSRSAAVRVENEWLDCERRQRRSSANSIERRNAATESGIWRESIAHRARRAAAKKNDAKGKETKPRPKARHYWSDLDLATSEEEEDDDDDEW
ncbi:hypothetical protein B0H14DRAFT_2615951 [Mycena olivaceomarginata]|nr:hypothetical protein B0H14DRAFT_2615951 [Mycena olivaceomarginata]